MVVACKAAPDPKSLERASDPENGPFPDDALPAINKIS